MKSTIFPAVCSLLVTFSAVCASAQGLSEKVTSASNIGLTVNQNGTFGNAFKGSFDLSNQPSCEYPRNSGIEHLFEAGIWIGASIDGSLISVSTSALDQPSGYSTGKEGYEFTTKPGTVISEKSSLINSPFYSPAAISHQDFEMDFTDSNIIVPGTAIQIVNHQNPLGLDVHLETYNWNYSFSDFFVILNYTITNISAYRLDSLYFGMWANAVVRNVNITPAGQGGSAFFDKGGNGYIDSLQLAYTFDANGDPGFTESYFSHKYLGAEDQNGFHHPQLDSSFKSNYQAWVFNNSSDPVFFKPTTDDKRYEKLTQGLNHHECWDENFAVNPNCPTRSYKESLNLPGNRSDLNSVGPFLNLMPGESINIAYAIVLAKKKEDGLPNTANTAEQQSILADHANWAQTAYNGEDVNFNGLLDPDEDKDGNGRITRYILPTPPDIPFTRIVPGNNSIDIYWSNNAEQSVDPISKLKDFEGYAIYMSEFGYDVKANADALSSLEEVARFDIAGNGLFYDTGFESIRLAEPVIFEGDSITYHYKYTVSQLSNGWQYAIAVTSFDQGHLESNLESLESSRLANLFRAFPGKTANDSIKEVKPFVYPNPYYLGAAWESGTGFAEDARIMFANLPERCLIRIFTTGGDLVRTIYHDPSYSGNDSRWFRTNSDVDETRFSGGEHAWDLLSQDNQIIARGLYQFSVQDLETGKTQTGKFVIVK